MEYITLGKTGLRVSRMGFGGIPIQKVDASVTHAQPGLSQSDIFHLSTPVSVIYHAEYRLDAVFP